MNIKQLEKNANQAIETLRRIKLKAGIPFMINTDLLPARHCYLEYPDGSIKVVTIGSVYREFSVIAELSQKENMMLRKKLKLNIFYNR